LCFSPNTLVISSSLIAGESYLWFYLGSTIGIKKAVCFSKRLYAFQKGEIAWATFGQCNFSFLKNSPVQINSKLN